MSRFSAGRFLISRPGISAKSYRAGLMLFALGVASGCGGNTPARLKTHSVSGVVTYQGKPVEGATVSFMTEKAPRAATGTTGKDGRYTLSTFTSNDGALAGDHQVMISKYEESEFTKQKFPNPEEAHKAFEAALAKGISTEGKHLLPVKYSNPATSGLTATVAPGKTNTFDFSLTD